jgi:hypothetical protein
LETDRELLTSEGSAIVDADDPPMPVSAWRNKASARDVIGHLENVHDFGYLAILRIERPEVL